MISITTSLPVAVVMQPQDNTHVVRYVLRSSNITMKITHSFFSVSHIGPIDILIGLSQAIV